MILVVGGGVAALEFVLALRDVSDAEITLVAPQTEFVPRPLLVGEAPGNVPRVRRALAGLAKELGFNHVRGAVSSVDGDARRVTLRSGGTLAYDTLVLAPGATRLPAFEDALHLGLDDLGPLCADIEAGRVRSVAVIAPTTSDWLEPLDAAVALFRELGARVTRTGDADRIVSLPLLRGPRIPGVPGTGLYGFIPVDEHLRVRGLAHAYAIGDATDHPLKQGAIACRQAAEAAVHIAASYGAPVA